jgi:hypothetical protein
VKAFTRRSCLAFASVGILGILGVAGCGPDNEAEGQKLNKSLGDPGKPEPNQKVETPVTKSQEDVFKQMQQNQNKMKQSTGKK